MEEKMTWKQKIGWGIPILILCAALVIGLWIGAKWIWGGVTGYVGDNARGVVSEATNPLIDSQTAKLKVELDELDEAVAEIKSVYYFKEECSWRDDSDCPLEGYQWVMNPPARKRDLSGLARADRVNKLLTKKDAMFLVQGVSDKVEAEHKTTRSETGMVEDKVDEVSKTVKSIKSDTKQILPSVKKTEEIVTKALTYKVRCRKGDDHPDCDCGKKRCYKRVPFRAASAYQARRVVRSHSSKKVTSPAQPAKKVEKKVKKSSPPLKAEEQPTTTSSLPQACQKQVKICGQKFKTCQRVARGNTSLEKKCRELTGSCGQQTKECRKARHSMGRASMVQTVGSDS